ncbi:MAG TPA: MaoC family dehydratase [Pseudonocardiaceae bacterium]|nr:MaoC family dehydratase [Pseudonocardiaceae bacterium]
MFDTPSDDRYFEDYRPGDGHEFTDTITIDGDRMVEFAKEFDPQPFHVDPATGGPFGGLIASGWHTAAIMMRLFADNYLSTVASLASPGVDEVRWHVPVRAGDTLRLRATVLDTTRSKSKPDRGIIHTDVEVLNQRDEVVMSLSAVNFMRLRDPN